MASLRAVVYNDRSPNARPLAVSDLVVDRAHGGVFAPPRRISLTLIAASRAEA